MTDLTPAEQAAAEALAATLNRHEVEAGNVDSWVDVDFADEARAVVAAVREPLFRDPKERLKLARELATGSPLTTAEAVEAVDRALNAQDKHRIQADALIDAADLLDRFAEKEAQNITRTHMRGRTLSSGIDAAANLLRKEANRHLGVQSDPV